MKEEKDYRKETIELLDKAQDAIIFLTTDRESADIIRKGNPDYIENVVTLALVQDGNLFLSILSSVVEVVQAQLDEGRQEEAKTAVRAIEVALGVTKEYLSSGLN